MAKSVNKIKTSGLELWTLRSWSSPSFPSKNSKLWGSRALALFLSAPCGSEDSHPLWAERAWTHFQTLLQGAATVLICLLALWASPCSEFLFIWPHDICKVQSAAKLFETQGVPKVLWPVEDLRRLTERKKRQAGRQAWGENRVHGVSEELTQSPPDLDDHRYHLAVLVPRKEVQVAPHILHL